MTSPPDALRAQVESVLGAPASYRWCGWPHGVSSVWEVRAEGHPTLFLKQHHQAHKFARARRFYREWRPHLPPITPQLVAELPQAFLITGLPGVRVQEAQLAPGDERALFEEAGRFLRALHSMPYVDEENLPLADDLAARMDEWLAHARDYVDAADCDWVAERWRPLDAFRDAVRVPGLGDFQPRNWTVDRSGGAVRLGVFDFDHARPDTRHLSFVKLWDSAWIGRPDLEAAFWSGYGGAPSPDERFAFEQACYLHAIGVIVWSRKHADTNYEAHGRRLLAQLKS